MQLFRERGERVPATILEDEDISVTGMPGKVWL